MYNDELTKKLAETAKRIIAGESIEEATFKKGNMVTHKGKVGKITNVSGDKQSIDVEFNDGSTDSFEPNELKVFKEATELNEAKIDKVLDLLINAIGKNSSKPEFQKASQAYEDWANAFGNSRKRLLERGPKAFWMDLEEALDIRLDDGLIDFSVESVNEATGDKEAYTKFFNDTLKKYGVKSPAELKGDDEKKFYDEIDAGWKGDDEKPEKNESVELEEGKIDLNKKFNTSDAAFDYFHSFAVADQAKSDQEVEKSKKKFAKNTLGFWMQNLTDTLKGMGISEETELELTEEEEEIVASILDTIPDEEAAADDDNHPDEEDILATLDKTTGYKVVDNLPEETEKLDARRREFREKIRKLAYEKAKKMIKGISDADDEEEKVEGVDKPLKVQKDEATGAVSVAHVKEDAEQSEEAKSDD